ncbi:hypothetical protein F5Y14DRAFT_192336 [Nemania sp. NC0429]|nr:hypothetical protein F5Y14DRAFT_192336 [Nemania sp. NC0429]
MAEIHYRTGHNVCSASCPINHIHTALDKIKEPSNSWPDLRGLHSLNYTRDAWLTGDAIEVSIKMYLSGLPLALQETVWVGIPGVDPKVWHMGSEGDAALLQAVQKPARRALKMLKSTEFSLVPICTDSNHWILVVVHKAQMPTAPDMSMEWSHVVRVAIIDPFHSAPRARMVQDRLHAWLMKAGGFTFDLSHQKIVWLPLQQDSTSCGPRAYWSAKQILDRLLMLHEARSSAFGMLWAPLSGWFSEEFVRAEMMGRCAWAAVRAMDYKARISIECVNEVRDIKIPNRPPIDAGAAMKPVVDDKRAAPVARPGSTEALTPSPKALRDAKQAGNPPSSMSPSSMLPGPAASQPQIPPGTYPPPHPAQTAAQGAPIARQPPPRVPAFNQHQVAPDVRPARPDMTNNDRHPAWAPRPDRNGTTRPPGPRSATSNAMSISSASSQRGNTRPMPASSVSPARANMRPVPKQVPRGPSIGAGPPPRPPPHIPGPIARPPPYIPGLTARPQMGATARPQSAAAGRVQPPSNPNPFLNWIGNQLRRGPPTPTPTPTTTNKRTSRSRGDDDVPDDNGPDPKRRRM